MSIESVRLFCHTDDFRQVVEPEVGRHWMFSRMSSKAGLYHPTASVIKNRLSKYLSQQSYASAQADTQLIR